MQIRLAIVLVAIAVVVACEEDPFLVRWVENPRQAQIYALDRGELSRPTAFHMLGRTAVVIEDPTTNGEWDFALDRQAGGLVLLLPRALGVTTRAAIAALPATEFEAVREAPADTLLYSTRDPVPLKLGTVYVVRTHQQPDAYGQLCSYYGKVKPLELDVVVGSFTFLYDISPVCNNRSLVPPK
ncbi:MAG: hypothetical protein EXR92_05045 [Gemmatimonadetes bacterium]|nr:hypothetical protein [Gemmatimonadota bacterium]